MVLRERRALAPAEAQRLAPASLRPTRRLSAVALLAASVAHSGASQAQTAPASTAPPTPAVGAPAATSVGAPSPTPPPEGTPTTAASAPATTAPPTVTPAPVAPTAAPPAAVSAAPTPTVGDSAFAMGDAFGGGPSAADLTLKLYGDAGMSVRDNTHQPWPTANSNANMLVPGVPYGFFATRLDLFATASIDRLSFLSEIMFEGFNNSIGVDVERMQISYLFGNWLRLSAGRSHMAWGYYNDTYHHGNLFELTTSRPYGVDFEDSGGIVMAHLVGFGADGTVDVGDMQVRYDLQVGNPRTADITAVPVQYAEGASPTLNARLRLMPIDGLILGVSGMRDVIPALAGSTGIAGRAETEELVGGAHVVYTEHHFLIDAEAFEMVHNPQGGGQSTIYSGFVELGYTIGAFTPYFRPEFIVFPKAADNVFQYTTADAQGAIVGQNAIYAGIQDFVDLRVGVKWIVMPQLALKLEGDRLSRDNLHMEYATFKAAYGF